jgi:hypothetical protein
VIRKYTVTVYQLLEEMLDNGYPLATEPNVLREMIRPPTWTAVRRPLCPLSLCVLPSNHCAPPTAAASGASSALAPMLEESILLTVLCIVDVCRCLTP